MSTIRAEMTGRKVGIKEPCGRVQSAQPRSAQSYPRRPVQTQSRSHPCRPLSDPVQRPAAAPPGAIRIAVAG
jgi:hypothetical protein